MILTINRPFLLRAFAIMALVVAAPVFAAGKMNISAVKKGGLYDRFIVSFNEHAPERGNAIARQQLLDAAGRGNGVGITQLRRLAVGADVIKTDRRLDSIAARQLMTRLAKNPHIDYVELDALRRPAFTPNDQLYPSQWHYSEAAAGIRLPAAWDQATGSGVVVAVIDTGITPHTDLSPNVITGYDFISDATVAGDGNGRDANPNDEGDWVTFGQCDGFESPAENSSWHGTHVAGTIAAVTNNHQGVAGVAFNAKVEPLRVLGHCGGYDSDIADAIVWASGGAVSGAPANANPAEVINMSLGGFGACGTAMQSAINTAVANGSVVVVAAGNDHGFAANFSPANCENVITVGAVARDGSKATYANAGPELDVSAPGGNTTSDFIANNVLSTINTGITTQIGEGYTGYQGTSMATPHVAGTVALMQSARVNSPAIVEGIIKGTARPFPVPCTVCGKGIVDAAAAVAAAKQAVLTISDAKLSEGNSGGKLATFTVSLSQPVATTVTFNIATADGTATAGSDYVARSSTPLSIAAGQTSRTVSVTINGDTVKEADETFLVNVSNVVGALAVYTQGRGTIFNDDSVVLTNGLPAAMPPASAGQQQFYTLNVPPGATDLNFSTYGNGGGDVDLFVKYGSPPTLSSFDCVAAQYYTNESCPTIANPQAGTYYVMLYAFYDTPNATVTGRYVDSGSMAKLSIDDVTVTEGNSGTKLMNFTVKLSRPQVSAVSYTISTSGGTAEQDVDYVSRGTTDSIPAGQTSKTFTITVKGDTTVEGNDTFFVNLNYPVGAVLGDSQGMGTILNDDGQVLTIANVSVSEGNSGTKTATFTAKLAQPATDQVYFDIATADGTATAGGDYVAIAPTQLTILYGQINTTFSVTINGDTVAEPDEAYFININNVYGASFPGSHVVGTITNDDAPTLSIDDVSITEGNSGTKMATFTVKLSKAATVPVTYNIATANGTAIAGNDFVARALTGQTIPAGQTSKTFSVTINGDTTAEANETFSVNLSNVSGAGIADAQAQGTITDDDTAYLSIGDIAVSEGNSGSKLATFTINLTQASTAPVTYTIFTADGSAKAGKDYIATTLFGETIPAGQTSRTFTVSIPGDTMQEGNKTFVVNVADVVGAVSNDSQATATILNDDGPTLSIGDVSIAEGNYGTTLATFTVTLSQIMSIPISYNIATANGSAAAGVDYVANSITGQSIPAGQTSQTFTVIINGDSTMEQNEAFYVNLSAVSYGTIFDSQAAGYIVNDDGPTLSINDASLSEGNSGTQLMTFTVTLSQPAATAVTYSLATANGTATAGSDYVAVPATPQSIPAGQTSQPFIVTINGDATIEPNETFLVNLTNTVGASKFDGAGVGSISNDD